MNTVCTSTYSVHTWGRDMPLAIPEHSPWAYEQVYFPVHPKCIPSALQRTLCILGIAHCCIGTYLSIVQYQRHCADLDVLSTISKSRNKQICEQCHKVVGTGPEQYSAGPTRASAGRINLQAVTGLTLKPARYRVFSL
jgi:hypothetical protein